MTTTTNQPPEWAVKAANEVLEQLFKSCGIVASDNVTPDLATIIASHAPDYAALGRQAVSAIHETATFVAKNSGPFNLQERGQIQKRINGALCSSIEAHGPITRDNCSSASKRVIAVLKEWNRAIQSAEQSAR